MAEKDTVHEAKAIVEAVPEELEKLEKVIEKIKDDLPAEKTEAELDKEEGIVDFSKLTREERRAHRETQEKKKALEGWVPKTELGRQVRAGKGKDIDLILAQGKKILEPEIVDLIIPNLQSDLILIGQAKGKFGGGKRRAWRQTQKKTKEGNILSFSSMAIVGDMKDHIGVGYGKAKETLPARAKALRHAKLNLIKIKKGWETAEPGSKDPHTVPFRVEGKCGSVKIKLIPAPRGTGLAVADECKKILRLAGIKDVYGVTQGHTRTTFNLAKACVDALSKTTEMKL